MPCHTITGRAITASSLFHEIEIISRSEWSSFYKKYSNQVVLRAKSSQASSTRWLLSVVEPSGPISAAAPRVLPALPSSKGALLFSVSRVPPSVGAGEGISVCTSGAKVAGTISPESLGSCPLGLDDTGTSDGGLVSTRGESVADAGNFPKILG